MEPCLDVGRADRRAAGHHAGGREARGERRHVVGGVLERVAGRYQPPRLVERERIDGRERNAAVPAVRRIERPAEDADVSQGSMNQFSRS